MSRGGIEQAPHQPPRRSCVLVADLRRDRFDGVIARLEQRPGLVQLHPLDQLPGSALPQRSLCWVLIEQVRGADWLCGGVNLHAQAIPCIVTVKVPAGVLDARMRKDYVQGLHQAIEHCVGQDDGRMLMTSIQLVDVADGTWGANGNLWHLADFTRAAGYGHLLARARQP